MINTACHGCRDGQDMWDLRGWWVGVRLVAGNGIEAVERHAPMAHYRATLLAKRPCPFCPWPAPPYGVPGWLVGFIPPA